MVYLKEEWVQHPKLKKYQNKSCTGDKCECGSTNSVELWEHDSCIRGRIDTEFCLDCDGVKTFSIIR
jgi:hypothetical protein|tara:strand:- start:2385 stop:2585 length:201 start_codon:yes stop_codon:yes gene_type:complete